MADNNLTTMLRNEFLPVDAYHDIESILAAILFDRDIYEIVDTLNAILLECGAPCSVEIGEEMGIN